MSQLAFGDKIKHLRDVKRMNQKQFSEYLGIAQPTLSAYENNKISPNIDVLIHIADKCDVSLDWLFGRQVAPISINSFSDIARFLFNLFEVEEMQYKIIIHGDNDNNVTSDALNDTDYNNYDWVSLRFSIHDKKNPNNTKIFDLIRKIGQIQKDFESYFISKETYEAEKERIISSNDTPLKRRELPNYSRKELNQKRVGVLLKEMYPHNSRTRSEIMNEYNLNMQRTGNEEHNDE